MTQKIDENIFVKGGSEGQEIRNRKWKILTLISGSILVIVAVALFLMKSDFFRNRLALLGTDAEYFVYVEQEGWKGVNSALTEYYGEKREQYEENGFLSETGEIQFSARAAAVLKTWLSVLKEASEAEGTFCYSRKEDTYSLTGNLLYGETEQPVEITKTEENYSLNSLLGTELFSEKEIRHLLEKYEALFWKELVSNGDVHREEKVLRSLGECASYQRALHFTVNENGWKTTVEKFILEIHQDQRMKTLYESGNLTEISYEERLTEWEKSLSEGITNLSLTAYVDNYGHITGRDIKMQRADGLWNIGYGYVSNGGTVGLEAYVKQEETTYLYVSGDVNVEKNGVAKGKLSIALLAEEELQNFEMTLQELQIIDILRGRVTGTVWLTTEKLPDASLEISLDATNVQQDIAVSVWYGGAEQLFIDISVLQ